MARSRFLEMALTPIDNTTRWEFVPIQMPNEAGYWLWYILDFGYFNVGCVHVMHDSEKHLKHLAGVEGEQRKHFHVYKIGFITFTMYHQAHDHLPPMDSDCKPLVDGWIPFDFRTVGLVKEPSAKLVANE